jgi:REP-associated tyrosine transposase
MHPKRLRRLPTFSYHGVYRYSLTIATFERRTVFVEPEIVAVVRDQILIAAAASGFEVPAYTLMPDHLHAYVEAESTDADLVVFVKLAKQRSGFHGKRVLKRRVWQDGYYDRVLREQEDARTVIAYLLNNPVRAGLVKSAIDYPFSGSGACTLAELIDLIQIREG